MRFDPNCPNGAVEPRDVAIFFTKTEDSGEQIARLF